MGDSTPLTLRADLPYPITLTRLVLVPGQPVRRGDRLLEYSFLSATQRKENEAALKQGKTVPPEKHKNDMVGSWESPIDGEIVRWGEAAKTGTVIERRQASKPLVWVEQPCTHPVQIHGMCGVCGADLTNDDYLSRPAAEEPGPSRYPGSFELAHDALGVTVSTNEAKRLETLSRDTLLSSRRLSLIVDLDQTIIHTTVDPTVGEWMNEIMEDEEEERRAKEEEEEKEKKDKAVEEGGEGDKSAVRSTTPPMSPPPKREKNPNAEALKDVARFQLADDLPPGAVKTKGRRPEPVRWYYTKPRPGLTKFLSSLSELYEMHVYTMGTRTYADAICRVIDPEGKIFGGRILSRDESGSMSSKSLVRLFPTDQSMVVVIDDRSDVWGDCPNLVKVVPYDFFIGIGDINGSFLPPTQPAVTPIPAAAAAAAASSPSTAASSPGPETPPEIPSTEDGLLLQSKLLDDLAEKRPLAKLEEETERAEEEAESAAEAAEAEGSGKPEKDATAEPQAAQAPAAQAHHPHPHPHHRKQLLNPEDHELERVAGILREVHSGFYKAFDDRVPGSNAMPLQCDTPLLIQEIKDQVLSGCVIAFTGVIPRNVVPERSDIWQTAESFGALCVHELNDKVTHLVTATLGTEKMHRAARMPRTQVVWLTWLQTSIALWRREPEDPFLAHRPSTGSGSRGVNSRADSEDAKQAEGGGGGGGAAFGRAREPETDADGDTPMTEESGDTESEGPVDADGHHVSEDDLAQDAAVFDAAWDDDAQAEFDKFLEDGSDDDDDDDDEAHTATDGGDNDDSSSDDEPVNRSRSRAETPSVWSRAATPGPSILSRAGTPGPEQDPKHVRYADEENQPLESVRQPQPGDISSFPALPPRKRARLLLTAPTDDDDVPEANRMNYTAPGSYGKEKGEANGDMGPETDGEGTEGTGGGASEAESEDEFAQMLADSLAEE